LPRRGLAEAKKGDQAASSAAAKLINANVAADFSGYAVQ
jgi:hypothetical protein